LFDAATELNIIGGNLWFQQATLRKG
jgi:hypothetical protein